MDDSVIKVLRRNGSWENSKAKNENNSISSPTKNDGQVLEDDFKLDEKFQILAQEIKKRMYNREAIKKKSVNSHKGGHSKKSFRKDSSSMEDIKQLKIKILPYLKKLEKLIAERQSYLDSISKIDNELDIISEDILSIKKDYLLTINRLKKNMNFFDDSLDIIKYAKKEK